MAAEGTQAYLMKAKRTIDKTIADAEINDKPNESSVRAMTGNTEIYTHRYIPAVNLAAFFGLDPYHI